MRLLVLLLLLTGCQSLKPQHGTYFTTGEVYSTIDDALLSQYPDHNWHSDNGVLQDADTYELDYFEKCDLLTITSDRLRQACEYIQTSPNETN